MKIFSILLNAKLRPGQQSLVSVEADSGDIALNLAINEAKKRFGDFVWAPLLTTISEIKTEKCEIPQIVSHVEEPILTEAEKKNKFIYGLKMVINDFLKDENDKKTLTDILEKIK